MLNSFADNTHSSDNSVAHGMDSQLMQISLMANLIVFLWSWTQGILCFMGEGGGCGVGGRREGNIILTTTLIKGS